jgi:nucleoside-diphosphate-sugar epimerase
VLIAGCGFVGTALAARLVEDGARVWGLRRTMPGSSDLAAGVEPLVADLRDPDLATTLPEGLDRVFFTAAADAGDEASYRAAYVEALDNLLGVLEARDASCPRVLFTSSTSVYHQDDGSEVDETSPTRPESHRGRVMLEAEKRLAASPLEGIVVRLGGIYGPGRSRLVDRVREGRVSVLRGGPQYTNRIHRDDAAGCLAHLAALEAPANLYLGVDDEPADRREVVRWLARRLGAPEPAESDPGPGPVGSGKRCMNKRLRDSGYALRFPGFRDGYAAMLEHTA